MDQRRTGTDDMIFPATAHLALREKRLADSLAAVRRLTPLAPDVGIILGTGLGEFAKAVDDPVVIPYAEIPCLPLPGAAGHAGRLIVGRFAGRTVAVMQGRSHLYEGHSWETLTYPVRLLAKLGVGELITSCAAGGLAGDLQVGDLLILDDFVNLQFRSPHPPDSRTAAPSAQVLGTKVMQAARELSIPARRGVYVAVTGPNYETRAELRFLKRIADAVGMSTIPELTTARELGIEAVGIAAITNLCNPDRAVVADSEHVIAAAGAIEPRFRAVLHRVVSLDLCRRPSPPLEHRITQR